MLWGRDAFRVLAACVLLHLACVHSAHIVPPESHSPRVDALLVWLRAGAPSIEAAGGSLASDVAWELFAEGVEVRDAMPDVREVLSSHLSAFSIVTRVGLLAIDDLGLVQSASPATLVDALSGLANEKDTAGLEKLRKAVSRRINMLDFTVADADAIHRVMADAGAVVEQPEDACLASATGSTREDSPAERERAAAFATAVHVLETASALLARGRMAEECAAAVGIAGLLRFCATDLRSRTRLPRTHIGVASRRPGRQTQLAQHNSGEPTAQLPAQFARAASKTLPSPKVTQRKRASSGDSVDSASPGADPKGVAALYTDMARLSLTSTNAWTENNGPTVESKSSGMTASLAKTSVPFMGHISEETLHEASPKGSSESVTH